MQPADVTHVAIMTGRTPLGRQVYWVETVAGDGGRAIVSDMTDFRTAFAAAREWDCPIKGYLSPMAELA